MTAEEWMQAARRSRAISIFGAVAVAMLSAAAAPAMAETRPAAESFSLKILSPADARAYSTAFSLIDQGEFAAAEAAAAKLSNPLLLGRLGFAKLMHRDYRASYDELAGWLAKHRDQPEAARIHALALRRKPADAPAPAAPLARTGADWSRVEVQAARLEARTAKKGVDPAQQAAREAFYRGEVQKAYTQAVKSGESWIAGLSAFRLKRFTEARSRFAALAEDEAQDEWVRSGAAYWAARASIASGAPEAAPHYLAMAARTPYTFYGLIAERQLGLEPAIGPDGLDHSPIPARHEAMVSRAPTVTGADGAAVARLVGADPRAARAAAFAQIGMRTEAGQELRAGLQGADAASRRAWTQLGLALNVPITSAADLPRPRRARFDIAQFPTPHLAPQGGFTVDRALVYALVRQESRFNANATSPGGAYGLMQLMPATAARVAGDDKLKANPSSLKDPALNLRVGQDYVAKLLDSLDGDILHAVAAYNSGPGVIMKTLQRLGNDADSLLAIESMPGGQTREFVEKVMAGYWIYRNIFGQDSRTLDAAASGAKAVRATLDVPGSSTFLAAAN